MDLFMFLALAQHYLRIALTQISLVFLLKIEAIIFRLQSLHRENLRNVQGQWHFFRQMFFRERFLNRYRQVLFIFSIVLRASIIAFSSIKIIKRDDLLNR